MEDAYRKLKEQLQQFGPLRPSTWEHLLSHLIELELKAGESFVRQNKQIAYVASGLLKEYDAYGRKRPSIINFIPANTFVFSNASNVSHYLKACVPTTLLYLEAEPLWLYQYKELEHTLAAIVKQYLRGSFTRQYLLEIKPPSERIEQFREHFHQSLKYMMKKEMANYLNIAYHHFTRLYH